MANQRRYYERGMVDGSAARRLEAVPDRRREEPRPIRKTRTKGRPNKQKQGMDVVTCFVLVVSICATVYICMAYVKMQSGITILMKDVITLEKEVASLKKQNDKKWETLESSINLEEIYKVATKELGMVHAKKKQVYTYELKKSDRVRQYADIPD